MIINVNNEVEKIVLTIDGKQKDDLNARRMNLRAELRLAW